MISKRLSKFIKSLKIKKFRARENLFIVEGKKNVIELLSSSYTTRHLLATPEFMEAYESHLSNVRDLHEVTASDLQEIGTFKTNHDCLAVGEVRSFSAEDLDLGTHIFALDGVGDPGNLGTIIRTLDWFGFNQLVCSLDTAEFYNPKVLNATMGSFTRVKTVYTDLKRFIGETTALPVFGADLGGMDIGHWKPAVPSMLVMGSESHGISPEIKEKLKDRIAIPQYGHAESLNVAIATGIFCHHLRS